MDTLCVFDTICDAAKEYNLESTNIVKVCKGKLGYTGNNRFMYTENFKKLTKKEKEVEIQHTIEVIKKERGNLQSKAMLGMRKGSASPSARAVINVKNNEIFSTLNEAANNCNISVSSIGAACSGLHITANGCIYRYLDDFENLSVRRKQKFRI